MFHDKERFSVFSVQLRKTAEFRDYSFLAVSVL